MTGVPAIFVYPITSGIASAASVTPATTSLESSDLSKGRIPCSTVTKRERPRWRLPRAGDAAGSVMVRSPGQALRQSRQDLLVGW